MKHAWIILCPGQGAQAPGLGRSWFDASPAAEQTFGAADEILGDRLGARLSDLCFAGPGDRLSRTDVAQPALFTAAVASFQALVAQAEARAEAIEIVAGAGLSLGEYTALHLAGALSFADALRLVALRGRAMQAAAESSRGGMVALIGADEAQAEQVCADAAGAEVLVCANVNAPGQIVLSGARSACDRAVEVAGRAGIRATRLEVAGAFHSPLMRPAADRLHAALEKTEIREPRRPVLSNVTALPHGPGPGDGASVVAPSIRRRLVEQLTHPVRWEQCCRFLVEHAKGEMHELAPGKTLAGLMRRIDRALKVSSHDAPEA